MQLPLDIEHHRSLCSRIEARENGILYSSTDFTSMEMTQQGNQIAVKSGLADEETYPLKDFSFEITYTLEKDGLTIFIQNLSKGTYVLPLIQGELESLEGKELQKDSIFFLTGGFEATEYRFEPSQEGKITIRIH